MPQARRSILVSGLVPALVATSLAALAAPASAHGNVTVLVDRFGDLWAIGDDLGNNLRIGAGGADNSTFLVRAGDATTTVNGQAELTLFAPGTRIWVMLGAGDNVAWLGTDDGSAPSCCDRELVVVTRGGNDFLRGVGPFPSVFANMGAGNDTIQWDEGASDLRGALLRTGEGEDVIDVRTGIYLSRIELGPGNDRLTVGGETWDTQFDLGSGDDTLILKGGRRLDVEAGSGNDVLRIAGMRAGYLTLDAGAGQDDVLVTGEGIPSGGVLEPVSILLGPDDDRLRVGDAVIGSALFDGEGGRDVYLDLGNVFGPGFPELRSFEAPMVTPSPELGFSTWITGRVVAEHGLPVPGAVVLLPELRRWTESDASGAFRFDSIEQERETLELVVGATVQGRARSGATLVELVPHSNSAAGDVALAPDLRNVLVYGTPPSWGPNLATLLESTLVRLGHRPEQVSRLAGLPEDLAPYGVIWHIGAPIPADALTRLASFVRSGRGLILSGDTPALNAELAAFVNTLVVGAGIGIAGPEVGGPYAFNPAAAGGITRTPHVLVQFFESSFPGAITGLGLRNVLFTGTSASAPAGVWDTFDLRGGRGHLALVVSPFWIRSGSTAVRHFIDNLQTFLQREPDALAIR